MKNAIILILIGGLVGVVAASFIVPPMLGWYSSPGGLPQGAQVQAVVQIPEVIRYATSRLLMGQSIGGAVGAVVGLVLYVVSRRSKEPATPPSTPA